MCNHDTTGRAPPQDGDLNKFLSKSAACRSDIERAVLYGADVMPAGRLESMANCGMYLTFLHSRDFDKTKLETGFFCKNRLCPACAWRKAAHDAVEINCIMQAATDAGYELYFATLTAQSVKKTDLADAIRVYNAAYTAMMRNSTCTVIAGAIRKLEVTYNAEKDWYHPHIHSVWIVPRGWRRTKSYINRYTLADMWRYYLGGKYAVSADAQDVRRVKSASREDVMEFAKYPAKSCDYLQSKDVFETFYKSLKGVRLITHMKLARALKAQYKHGLLDCYKQPDTTQYFWRSMWKWARENAAYTLDQLEELSEPIIFGTTDTDETAGDNDADPPY